MEIKSKTPALEIRKLQKSFRSHWTFFPKKVVHNVTLKVSQGEAFGFLGPNGAGKTTTIKCILGLIKKTAGEILIDGEVLEDYHGREHIGYLPEHPYFYDHLSVDETLNFFAALYGIKKSDVKAKVSSALEMTGLEGKRKESVRSLSKGWQQRVGIAQAILNNPKLLILDEPFSGLDPKGRRDVKELILKFKAKGTTILMSSHILSDVHEICDRISVMKNGSIESVFSLEEMPEIFGEQVELVISMLPADSSALEKAKNLADKLTLRGKKQVFSFKNYDDAHTALVECMNAGAKIESFEKKSKNLEEVFVSLTEDEQKEEKVLSAVNPEQIIVEELTQ